MLCGLDDDDDTPEDPVIVPVKTRIPVHLLPDSCVRLCNNIIIVYVWMVQKLTNSKMNQRKLPKLGFLFLCKLCTFYNHKYLAITIFFLFLFNNRLMPVDLSVLTVLTFTTQNSHHSE